MSSGARKKEAQVPELKMPTAFPRSSMGNHSVVALMAAGKLPDSPIPRNTRAMQKPSDRGDKGVAHGGERPYEDGDSITGFCPQLIDHATGEEEANPIGDLKEDDDVSVVVVEDRLMESVGECVPTHKGRAVQQRLDE